MLSNYSCDILLSIGLATFMKCRCSDTVELVALYLLPSLLPPPMVHYAEVTNGSKRKWTWRPTVSEMMQAFIIIISVCMLVC